jgi:hypothetical protein
MHLLIIGWTYVVLMMAISEANSTQGTLLGAVLTFLLYGVLPLSIMVYLMATPARRSRRQAQLKAAAQPQHPVSASCSANTPDSGSHAAGDALSAERKEP